MEALVYMFSWGSPLGISLFLFIMASAAAILMWGAAQLRKGDVVAKAE